MKRIFSAISFALIAIMLVVPLSVSASPGWSEDISYPTWTPLGIVNNVGDGVWDGGVTVTGTSPSHDFDALYQKWVPDLQYDYEPKIEDVAGHYNDCPTDYEVDPGNPDLCRKLVTEGYNDCTYECPKNQIFTFGHQVEDVAGHYVYENKVVDVPGHYVCPSGYTFNGSNCQKWVYQGSYCGYWHWRHCDYWVDQYGWDYVSPTWIPDTYKCPDGYSNNPGHDNCRLWIPTTYRTEVFTVTFDYTKWDQDPHKCHCPTASSLDVPSWARSEFNSQFPEFLWATENCTWVPPVYDYVVHEWVPTTYKCPTGYEQDPANPDQCQKQVDLGGYIYDTRNFNGILPVPGCTDKEAWNYDPGATEDNGSCVAKCPYNDTLPITSPDCKAPPEPVPGCTDKDAWNYDPAATEDNGSCVAKCPYNDTLPITSPDCVAPPEPIEGCTDDRATNYDPTATEDDGSCLFGVCVNGESLTGLTQTQFDELDEGSYTIGSCTQPPETQPYCVNGKTEYYVPGKEPDGAIPGECPISPPKHSHGIKLCETCKGDNDTGILTNTCGTIYRQSFNGISSMMYRFNVEMTSLPNCPNVTINKVTNLFGTYWWAQAMVNDVQACGVPEVTCPVRIMPGTQCSPEFGPEFINPDGTLSCPPGMIMDRVATWWSKTYNVSFAEAYAGPGMQWHNYCVHGQGDPVVAPAP